MFSRLGLLTLGLVTFGMLSTAHADLYSDAMKIIESPAGQCAKETIRELGSIINGEVKAARAACADLRGCKKEARADKRDCKQTCKAKKGKAKKDCMKSCRSTKRSDIKSCREAYKTPACKTARRKVVGRITKGLIKQIKSPKCRKAVENLSKLGKD